MTNYTFTDQISLSGGQEIGGTLFWNSASHSYGFTRDVVDEDSDNNLDPNDYYNIDGLDFSGYYYVAPNGQTFAIFSNGTAYIIPYRSADYDLFANFPVGPANLSTYQASDFVPTGNPVCFLAGSLIATPSGEVAVESLVIGDDLKTQNGGVARVRWIGRQTVMTRFGPAERLMPVRFASGSLGDGVPRSDLTVTADHGMLVDGVICHAGALVNGTTITRVPLAEMGETYTVYHVETDAHEIILANGAPAETFIDNVSRRAFDNYAEFEALYGDVPEMEELPYPRAMSARQVPQNISRKLVGKGAA